LLIGHPFRRRHGGAPEWLIGLVTSETMDEMLMLHRAPPQGFRFGPWNRPGSHPAGA
jgi:hypothetical protein